ncbi:hypothetical protein C0J52_18951 [Blattella germanica]|nr:hypothetical protein C0J52_18951 [Blattella germanica]
MYCNEYQQTPAWSGIDHPRNTEGEEVAARVIAGEAKARIMGPADLYVKTGSSVSLTCVISQGPHDLGTVFWYRNAAIIQTPVVLTEQTSSTQPQPRVRIDTEWTEQLTSRLHISKARPTDSGNYTCIPTIAEPASVNLAPAPHLFERELAQLSPQPSKDKSHPIKISTARFPSVATKIVYSKALFG